MNFFLIYNSILENLTFLALEFEFSLLVKLNHGAKL